MTRGLLRRWYVYRSAITGKFVSAAYALAHPATTIRQLMKRWERTK